MSTSYPISIWSSITANQSAPCPHLCAQSCGYISPLADETVVFYLELGATDPLVRDIRTSCYLRSSFYQVAWSEKYPPPPLSASSAMRSTEPSAKAIFLRMLRCARHQVWVRICLSLCSRPVPLACFDFYRSVRTMRCTGLYALSIGDYVWMRD